MRVLGVNAVFHDPSAALVVESEVVAAAEEERFTRRKHEKEPVPFSTWEPPRETALWGLRHAGLEASGSGRRRVLVRPGPRSRQERRPRGRRLGAAADALRGARPRFLRAALVGLQAERVRFVAHHVSHAATAFASPFPRGAYMALDGCGGRSPYVAGTFDGGRLGEPEESAAFAYLASDRASFVTGEELHADGALVAR